MSIKNHTGKEEKPFKNLVDTSFQHERKSPEEVFEDTHAMQALLLNNSKELIILLDRNFTIQFINESSKRQFASLFNIALEKGQNLLTVASKENQPFIKEIYEDVLKGNHRETETSHLVNGEMIYLCNSFWPAKDDQGQVAGIIINTQDISAFKKNQLALEEAELRWQFASEGSSQGLWDWDIQTGYTYYSKSYKRLYGFEDDEIENHIDEWSSRIHPDDKEVTSKALENHFLNSEPTYDSSYRIKDKNGKYRWILSRGVIVSWDDKGQPLRMIGTHTDITKYKITEANYKLLFYSNPLPMWTYDLETLRFVEVNNKALEHYGYSREEFLKMTVKDIYPEEERLGNNFSLEKNSQNLQTFKANQQHLKKDGTRIYVDITGHIIEQDGSKICLITSQDVTDKLLAEQLLQESEAKYRTLFINNPLPSWIYDMETQMFLEVNDAAVAHYGYTKEEFRQLSIKDIHPVDEKDIVEEAVKASIKNKTSGGTWKHQKKNGEIIYVDIRSSTINYRDQQARLVVIHDKTKQVKAENELLKSNERFTFASMATSDAIWDMDLTQNTIDWGEGLTTLFGYKNEEVNIEKWLSLIHPDDAERVESSLKTAIQHPDHNIWRSQYRFKAANNAYRYVLDRGFILRNKDKSPYRLIGSIQDITDLKIKEKELLKSNERYKYVSLATSDIIWDWNLKKEQVLLSDNFRKAFGWNLPVSNRLPIKDCLYNIHPEDRDKVRKDALNAIKSSDCKHWETSFRFLKSKGDYAFVILKGHIIRNKLGKGIRMIGAIQDITDKKLKEQELTESNERFDAVLKATNDLIWDWNLESGNFYRDSDGAQVVYGVSNEKEIQSIYAWLQRIHPEDATRVQNLINDILHSGDQDTFEVEYRFRRDDNRYNFVYDRGIILRNSEGKPVRMIGAAQNITERKRLEMQLLKKELDKQKLISQATIETQEQERSEIGKELHDNVNQVLTTTKLYLDLSISNAEMKDELILKSSKNIIYVINEIRQLSRSLMNPSLGDLGLIESINELIDNINLTGKLKGRLEAAPSLETTLSENQKLMIYRIAQEAINNALKHAKAQNVSITIRDNQQWVELLIEDDGIGFNFDTVKKGSGLKHIQNRVYLANGTLNVNSAPGSGSLIIINFPKHTNPN